MTDWACTTCLSPFILFHLGHGCYSASIRSRLAMRVTSFWPWTCGITRSSPPSRPPSSPPRPQIGNAGAELLAMGLRHNSTLLELSLARNGVLAAGARRLGRALEANTALTR